MTPRLKTADASRGRDFDLPRRPDARPTRLRGLPPAKIWCFNIVGGEILTFPDTPTTQGLPLGIPMVFQHSGEASRATMIGDEHSARVLLL